MLQCNVYQTLIPLTKFRSHFQFVHQMIDANGRPHQSARLFMLENNDLGIYENYAWDGTFEIVKDLKPKYEQLVILSGLVTASNEQHRSTAIPIAFGLLPSKRKDDYLMFLRNVNRISGNKFDPKER